MFQRLVLRNFRNYAEAEVQFGPQVNILLGRNGEGKTNLLEALVLLCSSESFRYGDNETFVRKGADESLLAARAIENELEYDLRLQILKSRKHHQLNGKRVSGSDLIPLFHFVIFSPESLSSIKDGADQRRQLVDELLVSVDKKNGVLVRDFRKALKTRNRILKDYVEGHQNRTQTEALLESVGPSYFRLATELTVARLKAIESLGPEFNTAMQKISQSTKTARIQYEISGNRVIHFTHQDIHILLEKRASELHEAELGSGTSLVGPQKHDIVFLYDENDSRFFCSQGQQRALILSFKMAQIVYHRTVHGAYPILLLDDVLSELDEEKREALIHFLQEIRTQIFMTTTDLKMTGDLAKHDCLVIEIVDGKIRS
ncbi:MAG: DNA replication and repair protein RecF [Bdellovibrionaceae bacterium]|nr:DNA replication and repair protein RecF [Pseudobdellovibrionaceae bacterium]